MVIHHSCQNENAEKYDIEFEEDENSYSLSVIENSSLPSLPSTYSLCITYSLLSQINEELKFEFKNEKTLFEALSENYKARDKIPSPPISFSCFFSIQFIIPSFLFNNTTTN